MRAISEFKKVKQLGQAKAGAGWNKHVSKFQKRVGDKVIRGVAKKEIQAE